MKQILLTNDDGFDAAGLVALQNMLKSNLKTITYLINYVTQVPVILIYIKIIKW